MGISRTKATLNAKVGVDEEVEMEANKEEDMKMEANKGEDKEIEMNKEMDQKIKLHLVTSDRSGH